MPRKHTMRKRRQRGGESNAYTFGRAVSAGAPYASEVVPTSACQAVHRSGEIMGYSPPGRGGLPGFAGGGRRYKKWTLKQLKKMQRKTRGGRYTVDVGAALGGPNVLVPNTKLDCRYYGGGRKKGMAYGGKRRKMMYGGASHLLGSPDLAAYAAPTAGYTNNPSSWLSSTGAPALLQVPYEARTMNPACIKTGGGRRHKKHSTRRKKKSSWW